MMTYNTQRKKLILPEYGRNIQQMVEYCKTIENRDERNRCARTIIDTMGNLFPELRDSPDYTHKLWDHLAIMSEFELDIDYPYDVVVAGSLSSRPNPVDYPHNDIRFKHYGISLQRMIDCASVMDNGEERDALVNLIANHMKKMMLSVNHDGVDDERVFKDLSILSHGAINLDPSMLRLHEFREAIQPTTGKKKKKK